jgi:hypothetical protein
MNINMKELTEAVKKLNFLLQYPQPDLITWHSSVTEWCIRLKEILNQ